MSRSIDQSTWDQRLALIHQQQASGLPIARFCRQEGIHISNFHAWRRKLIPTARPPKPSVLEKLGSTTTRQGHDLATPFIQVPLVESVDSVPNQLSPAWIEISIASGIVMRVPASNPTALKLVLSTLQNSGHGDHV